MENVLLNSKKDDDILHMAHYKRMLGLIHEYLMFHRKTRMTKEGTVVLKLPRLSDPSSQQIVFKDEYYRIMFPSKAMSRMVELWNEFF